MTNPTESTEQKPSSSEQPPQGKNSPQNAPSAQERTGQNESNVNQSKKSSDEGDNVKMSKGGDDKEKIGKNNINVTQAEGDAETEGSGRDNVKGQGTPADLENEGGQNEKNVTDQGEESGGTGGGSSSLIPRRKRGRRSDPIHVGSSSGSKARKKGQLDVPSCAPTCYVCKKTFASWKGVFGHLRAHRRQTPGAFPPPTFTPEGSPERNIGDKSLKEQLAPTLLNLARETMQKMSQDSNTNTTVATGVASPLRRGLDIDLNELTTNVLLDLNNPPPPEKDDDDEEADKIA